MSAPIIHIHNAATGESIEQEMTPEEIAELEATQAEAQAMMEAEAAAEAAREAARESALAKLAALGLTKEEASTIIK